MTLCAVDGCVRAAQRRGWCSTHYARWYRTGSTGPATIPTSHHGEHLGQRFWRFVARGAPDECWLWHGEVSNSGYGSYRAHRSSPHTTAHRVAYELEVGPIPVGLQLDHLCRTKLCVNPRHLEPVTARVNLLRSTGITAKNALKTCCDRGGHPLAGPNLRVLRSGARSCRTCARELQQARRRATA